MRILAYGIGLNDTDHAMKVGLPLYSRLAGYEDTNDAERLAEDPAFRMLASRERSTRRRSSGRRG